MRCRDLLSLPAFSGTRIVGGGVSLDQEVRWVHVIDNPDAATWARPGQLVLTTGFAWPRDVDGLRKLFRSFAAAGVTAVGLAVPHFFERFPDCLVEDVSSHELVLIEVPWEVPFAQITEEVHTAILGEQARVIERSEAIHRALTRAAASAASLDVLARILATETGHEVAIVAASGDVLASTLAPEASRVLEALARPRSGGKFATSGPAPRGAGAAPWVEGIAWRLPADVHVQGVSVATVWLLGASREAGALERRAVEHAALVTALRLTYQRELRTVESRLRRSFVDDLLEGRVDESGLVAERAHAAGFSSRASYRVAIAELDLPLPLAHDGFERREAALDRVRATLLRAGASDLLTTSSNRVFAVVPEEFDPEELWVALADPRARLVVSRLHAGTEGVRRALEESRSSLRHVARGSWAHFDTLVLPRAVRGDVEAQRALVAQFVEPLTAARSGARLIDTLFALAQQDFVLTATAEALGIHISTLRHRLERIEDRLGIDLHDAGVRLRLRVAGYIREIEPGIPT